MLYEKENILWPEGRAPDPAFCSEDERLSVLAAYGTDALSDDDELQQIADFAAKLCDVPYASVTVVERTRQNFLAEHGLDRDGTPRSDSFCAHAMLRPEPMVVEDATKDPLFADNGLVTGEMGLRFYAGVPLVSTEGAPLGALCVIDTTPRPGGLNDFQMEGLRVLARAVMRRMSQMRLGQSAVEAVERREADLRDMIDSVPGIAWMGDPSGNFTYVNARWGETTGLPVPTRTEEWREAIHPEDWDASVAKFRECVAKEETFEDEWRIRMADGSYRWVQSRAVPVSREGNETRWFGTVIDIDTMRRLSESRDLLARELSHRIKNIFAVISGLIAIRSRGKDEVKDFARDLSETVRALGTAHDYVRPLGGRQGETLSGLLSDLLAPYESAEAERLVVTGPGVKIGQRAATPLALVYHELATNSAKYGALSCPEGQVRVTVEDDCEGEGTVCIVWEERAIPCGYTPPEENEGFGSRLLRMAVEGQLGGSIERSYSETGLEVRIAFPRKNILD